MRIESHISECGTVIMIVIKQDDQEKITIEIDPDDCRKLMLMLGDTLIRAGVMHEFHSVARPKEKN
jgi:hypothetical protein